jgi:hypothetical protein
MAPLDWLPLSDFVPDQAPDAEHAVVSVLFHVSTDEPPDATVVGLALSWTVGAALETEAVAVWVAVPPTPLHVNSNSVSLVIASVVSEPFVATEPIQPPDAVQLVAPLELQVRIALAPGATVVGLTVSDTTGGVVASEAAVTATVTDFDMEPPVPEQLSENIVVAVNACVVNPPEVGCVPLHPPEAIHACAPVDCQWRITVWPYSTDGAAADKLSVGVVLAVVASACDVLPVVTPLLSTVELIPHAERIAALVKPRPRMSSRRGKQTKFMQVSFILLHDIVFAFLTSANVSRFANDWQVHVSQFTDACIERNAARNPRRGIRSRV